MVGNDGVMLAIGDLSTGHKRTRFKNPSGGAVGLALYIILPCVGVVAKGLFPFVQRHIATPQKVGGGAAKMIGKASAKSIVSRG